MNLFGLFNFLIGKQLGFTSVQIARQLLFYIWSFLISNFVCFVFYICLWRHLSLYLLYWTYFKNFSDFFLMFSHYIVVLLKVSSYTDLHSCSVIQLFLWSSLGRTMNYIYTPLGSYNLLQLASWITIVQFV